MNRGVLIVFEGIDGSGKSTQARRLAEALRARGEEVVLTREPTDSPAGRELQRIARAGRRGVSVERESALFQEDRALHCAALIEPALGAGKIVVCDRYWPSTVAYQGALGADAEAVAGESRRRFPAPNLIVYLAIPVARAMERIEAGRPGGPAPGYEKAAFLEKVLTRYEAQMGPLWRRFDALEPVGTLAAKIGEAVVSVLDRQGR